MIRSQPHTPKYWVINNPESDDINISTASKSAKETAELYKRNTGNNYIDDNMENVLISIEFAMGENDDLPKM